MKQVVIHRPGGYARLEIEEAPDPVPGPDEVLVDVTAIGVNFADCVTRMGLYASARHYVGYPITPGFEISGHVRAGDGAQPGLAPGTPVMAVTRFNGYADCVAVPRAQVMPLPPALDLETAAGFPVAALTAWYALFEMAHACAGDTVLVHSAAGGVGGFLVQIARLAGCRVVGVVGSTHKVDAVRASGADAVIDKSNEALWPAAERLAPAGYDIVLDANGATTLKQSYRHLAPTGRLVVYGFHGMLATRGGRPRWLKLAADWLRTPRFSPFDLTTRNRAVLGFNLSYLFDRRTLLARGVEQLLAWLEEDKLRMPGITTYPFADVAAAHRDLESGRTVGKLVLLV